MSELPRLLAAGSIGVALGVFFFGGLWWTVRTGLRAKRPELWFLFSSVLRVSVVLAGFAAASDRRWERLVACVLGFAIARLLSVEWSRGRILTVRLGAKERHAPQPR